MAKKDPFITGIVFGTMAGIVFMIFLIVALNPGYKQGQIDCVNGDVKVQLVKQEDNELIWEWKNE